jgi:hypothetical protein
VDVARAFFIHHAAHPVSPASKVGRTYWLARL